jgi:hypothetical protein
MPNFLEQLRMRNIFDPSAMANNDQFGVPQSGIDETINVPNAPMNLDQGIGNNDAFGVPKPQRSFDESINVPNDMSQQDQFMQAPTNDTMYSPDRAARGRLDNMLGSYPGEDPPASKWKKFGAVMAGGLGDMTGRHGMQFYDEVLHGDRNQKIEDWKNQIGPANTAAGLESRADIAGNREARLTDQGNRKLQQTQQKLDHIASREDLTDSEKLALTQEYKTQLQELSGTQKIEQIDTKGEVDKDVQRLRGSQKISEIGATGAEARKTKAVVPGGAGATSQLPTQQKVAYQLRANKAIQENPDWKDYISTDPNTGMVDIVPPHETWYGGHKGPDDETYKKIIAYIQGNPAASASPVTTGTTTPARDNSKVQPGEEDRVKVLDAKTGNVLGTVLRSEAGKLNPKKYKVQ